MAAPNLIGATTINGKTTGANLTTTSATTVLNNPASSGKCLKVNTLNVSNYGASAANITIAYNNGANLGGTSYAIAGNISVPSKKVMETIPVITHGKNLRPYSAMIGPPKIIINPIIQG